MNRFFLTHIITIHLRKMALYQALLNRHTIRNYDPSYVIPKDILEKIAKVVQISPNSMAVQGVDAYVVSNKDKLQQITDSIHAHLPKEMVDYMNARKQNFKVSNVVTCDASAVIYLAKNERSNQDCKLDAGVAAHAVCMAAANFGLDTMCHSVCASPGTAEVLGLPADAILIGVAIGKRRPDAFIPPRQSLNKIHFVE